MATRCKIGHYIPILLKMYWMIFMNTSGNVLIMLTNKNGAKYP